METPSREAGRTSLWSLLLRAYRREALLQLGPSARDGLQLRERLPGEGWEEAGGWGPPLAAGGAAPKHGESPKRHEGGEGEENKGDGKRWGGRPDLTAEKPSFADSPKKHAEEMPKPANGFIPILAVASY